MSINVSCHVTAHWQNTGLSAQSVLSVSLVARRPSLALLVCCLFLSIEAQLTAHSHDLISIVCVNKRVA